MSLLRKLVISSLLALAALSASAQTASAQSDPPHEATPPSDPSVMFGGFGDAVFIDPVGAGQWKSGFETGELDLFVASKLSDAWSALGEGFVYHAGQGEEAYHRPTKRAGVVLERLYVAYSPSDRLRLEFGEIHTGIVGWNEREHRGRFLQTPIDVPSIANREEQGGAWPLRFVGVTAQGRLPGPLGLHYEGGVGEARGTARDDIQPLSDARTSLAGLLSLSIAPDRLPGFEAGASGYVGHIPAPDGTLSEHDLTLFTSYTGEGLELRGEWAEMNHHQIEGLHQTYITRGWYTLASWRPRGALQRYRPYFIYDHLAVPRNELYLHDVYAQSAWAAGVRWDVSRYFALKGDFRSELAPYREREHLLRLQVAFSF